MTKERYPNIFLSLRYIGPIVLLLIFLGGVSRVVTHDVTAQGEEGTALCAATVETTSGQGRFSIGGMGRFSIGGMEGANAILEPGDGGLTEEEVNLILENTVNASWLINAALPWIDGTETGEGDGFGDNSVALYIVDDFSESYITLQQLIDQDESYAQEFYDQFFERYGYPPDPGTPIQLKSHGHYVEEVALDLIAAFESRNPRMVEKIRVVRVNIADGNGYSLDLIVPAIQNAVATAQEMGVRRHVINMSWGVIPCFEDQAIFEFGGSEPFSFYNWLEFKNFQVVFDIDGGLIENEPAPSAFNDFGLEQYLVQQLGLPIENVLPYLQYLFSSVSDEDPSFAPLRDLMKFYLSTSDNPEAQFRLIPVASSGNYADIQREPLAPSRFPEIIAAGATLGMDGELWEYSQDANGILPGAWYHFGDGSYRAGTSFSAPYLSVISALYLTYPDACDFAGGVTPLTFGDADYGNYTFIQGFLACKPGPSSSQPPTPTPETPTPETPTPETPTPETPTPETPTPEPDPAFNLLNPGFEDKGETITRADQWVGNSTGLARRKCNRDTDGDGEPDKIFAHSGNCALQVRTRAGVNTRAVQVVEVSNLDAGDMLQIGAWVETRNMSTGGRIRAVVVHPGNPNDKVQFTIPTGTNGYQELTAQGLISLSGASKIKLMIRMNGGTGKFFVDDIIIGATTGAPLRGELELEMLPTAISTPDLSPSPSSSSQ